MAVTQAQIMSATCDLFSGLRAGRIVARGSDGRQHVIYIDDSLKRIQYRYSDDDGATWSAAEVVVSNASSTIYAISLAVDGDDEPVVAYSVYQESTVGAHIVRREVTTWTHKTYPGFAKSASTYNSLRLLYDPTSDEFYLLQGKRNGTGGDIDLKVCTNDLVSWGSSISIYSDSARNHGILDDKGGWDACLDRNGDVWVAVLRDDSALLKISCVKWDRSTSTLGSWDDVATSIVVADAGCLTMLVDKTVKPYVFAVHQNGTSYGQAVVYDKTGASWTSAETAYLDASYDIWAGLGAIADDGSLTIPCIRNVIGTDDDLILRYRNPSGTWSTARTQTDKEFPGCMIWCGACWYSRAATGFVNVFEYTQVSPDRLYTWFESATTWAEDGISASATDALEFDETGERYFVSGSKTEGLVITEVASEIAILNVQALAEGVELGERAGLIHEVLADDALELDDAAARAYAVLALDAVEFDELAKRLDHGEDPIEFGDSASASVVIIVSGSDALNLVEGAAHLPIEGCETDFGPSPAIQSDPSAVTYVYLMGPWATLEHVMRLPRPDFGDVRRSRLQVITHRTRGGQRRVYKRTPTYRSLVIRFSGLSRLKLLELEAFLESTAGEDIRYIDHEARTWRGNMLTSPADLTHQGPEQGEAMLEFEGETVSS